MEKEEIKRRFESLSELKKIRFSIAVNKKITIILITLMVSIILDCFAFNYLINFLGTLNKIYIIGIIGYLLFAFYFLVMALYSFFIEESKEQEFLLKNGKNSKA